MSARESLKHYRDKRNFARTPEPSEDMNPEGSGFSFVIQKHAARNLHYDFRLELGGTLKSWAVPKGPSLDPSVKRMGVHVEDHPLSYANFEGRIPAGQYGAGNVIVWDRGTWTPVGDPAGGLETGKLKFELSGEKLKGSWTLVRMHSRKGSSSPTAKTTGHEPWLLIKERDEFARPATEFDVVAAMPDSVLSGQPLSGNKSSAPTAKRVNDGKQHQTSLLPEGAREGAIPVSLAPQLATLVETPPPDSSGWLYEIKFDGYRLMTRIDGGRIDCFTRNGHNWTQKLPALVKAISQLEIESGWLDGEIVVLNDKGLPDFGALQNAFDQSSTSNIVYYVFDLPWFDSLDLRGVRLADRREILRTVITRQPQDSVRFSEAFDQHSAADLLASAARLGLEGLIGKRADAPYASGRSRTWVKLKTQQRQEFVIGGYTAPKGSRSGLGALLLGVHDANGKLRYAGNVGTGFDEATLSMLKSRLEKIHVARSPFVGEEIDTSNDAKGQWVKPKLVAEVSFGEWTNAGRVRHAVFRGLRTDKPASAITREAAQRPASDDKATTAPPVKLPGRLRITHPERVIDRSSGFTKMDLIEHYLAVAPLMLTHLKDRPVALVRAPSGIDGELFFQKHAEAKSIPGITLLDPSLDPGHAPLLVISTRDALLQSAQMNVIEFHTWNATRRSIQKPDRMTFDLDPGEGVGWPDVQDGAQLVKTLLDELRLPAFLKTSGGKGLHVVVPLKPSFDFAVVKNFSHAIVQHLAQVIPQRFVAKSGPRNRIGRIFVDYLRNGSGATTVAAWSVRARPGLGVSVPIDWDELASVTSGAHWQAGKLARRITTGNSAWAAYESSRTTLSGAMKQLGFKPVSQTEPSRKAR